MKYQLCMRDEYGQTSIIFTDDVYGDVLTRAKREINSANVDNALTTDDKKRNWDSFMIEIIIPEGSEYDEELDVPVDFDVLKPRYTYAGKNGQGKDMVFDYENETFLLSEIIDGVEFKMYLGHLDGEDWYAEIPRRGGAIPVTDIKHQILIDKNMLYIRCA